MNRPETTSDEVSWTDYVCLPENPLENVESSQAPADAAGVSPSETSRTGTGHREDRRGAEDKGDGVSQINDMELSGCNRARADRREFHWRTVVFGFLRSRRRSHRRSADAAPVFVDWHHPWLFFLATGIMLLSTLDAFFTLELLQRGAVEVNPVMAFAIEQGTAAFAGGKMLLTGLGILMLVFLSRSKLFDRLRTGILLTVFFSAYAGLVCYQFTMLLARM